MKLPPLKTAEFSALNLLSAVGMTLPNHLRKISGMLLQALGAPDEDDTLLADRCLDVGIGGLAVELRFDAGQEFALLLGNAEALEGALHVVRHIVPTAAGFGAPAQVVTDVVEDDIFEVLGRPMGRHRLFVEDLESLVPELANPVRLAFHIGDVVDGLRRQAGARVEGVGFRVGKIPGAAVDANVGFRSGHKRENEKSGAENFAGGGELRAWE